MKKDNILGCGAVSVKDADCGLNYGQTFDIVDTRGSTILVWPHGNSKNEYAELDLAEVQIMWNENRS